MKQAFHIFAKDVRRHWIEIAVMFALLVLHGHYVVLSWNEPSGMASGVEGLFFSGRFLPGLVGVLLPAAWVFLVLRIVHDESLVGDRQFWLTRPYDWRSLLAAKVIFVFVVVNLPSFLLQLYLLHAAGFSVSGHLTGVFGMQLANMILLLPVLTLASITASLPQVGLGIIAIVLYVVGVTYISSAVPSSSFSGPADTLQLLMFLAVCVCVVLIQYSRRLWWRSLTIVGALAIAVVLTVVVWPYRAVVRSQYPSLSPAPITFSIAPPKKYESPRPKTSIPKDQISKAVSIQIPLMAYGIAEISPVSMRGWHVTLEFPDGSRWNSGWRSGGGMLFPDSNLTQVSFELERSLFERWKSSPIKAEVQLAMGVYRERDRRNFVVPEGTFTLAGAELCAATTTNIAKIECRAPFHRPASLLVRADLSKSTCPTEPDQAPFEPGERARNYVSGDTDLIQPGISPVVRFDISLNTWNRQRKWQYVGICPHTPLILSNLEIAFSGRTELNLPNLKLADYEAQSFLAVAVRTQ